MSTLGSSSARMRSDESWLPLQSFPERGRAEALCVHLQVEGVPSKIEARALANAIETEYWVCVPHLLAHRARWVLALPVLTDGELDFLATGKLPGQDSNQ